MIPIRNDLSMSAPAESWSNGAYRAPEPCLRSDGSALLSHADYEAWLLPPLPRDGIERVVHLLSSAAGIGAVALFSLGFWLIA